MIRIVGVGDIMPGGLLHGSNRRFVSDRVSSLLNEGDVRVGTLECAIGNNPCFLEGKMSRYGDVLYAPDEDLKRVKDLNINIVSLANNHLFDLGESGARHTIALLDEMGILHCGAGMNLEEARRPAVFEKDGLSVAFLAFCDTHRYMGYIPFATETSAGVNPLHEEYALNEIKNAKRMYDYVVVIPHWGREHTFETTVWCYRMADKMFKAGADLILGGHTHRVQPIINKRHNTVAFSMGNFLFPDRLIAPPLRATYYTDDIIDINRLPKTDKYPVVKELTYKVWPPLARYGMIVTTTLLKNSIESTYHLTHIDSNSFIDLSEGNMQIKRGLAKYHFLLGHTPYQLYISIKRRIVSLFKRKKESYENK